MKLKRFFAVAIAVALVMSLPVFAAAYEWLDPQDLPVYDEFLPDPFQFYGENGRMVTDQEDWYDNRVPEIKDLAAFYEYGYYPPRENEVVTATIADADPSRQGYPQKTLTITITNKANNVTKSFNATLAYPTEDAAKAIPGPYPVVIGAGSAPSAVQNYGYVTASYTGSVVCADSGAGNHAFANAYTGVFYDLYPYEEYDAGNFVAWAWGASKVLDALYYLQENPNPEIATEVDPTKAAVTGFSRNGKAALVAGLYDERFGVVNPGGSGSAGAGVYRVAFDRKNYPWYTAAMEAVPSGSGIEQPSAPEMIRDLQQRYPWWFTSKFLDFTKEYSDSKYLPFDHHELVAAIAPRGVIANVGYGDYWLNSEGMYVSYTQARSVYEWLGVEENIAFVTYPTTHANFPADYLHFFVEFLDSNFRGAELEEPMEVLPIPAASGQFSHWTPEDLAGFNAYKLDPVWATTRPLGSPDEVVGLKSVKYLVDGSVANIPATVKAINNAGKKVMANLYINGELVDTQEVVFDGANGKAAFLNRAISKDNTYTVAAYFEGDQPTLRADVPVIEVADQWWTARIGQRWNGSASNPTNVQGSGYYVIEFSDLEDSWDVTKHNWTKATHTDDYKVTIWTEAGGEGVNAKAVVRDQEGPYKCCFTLVPDEDIGNVAIGNYLRIKFEGVVFPELFPDYSFTFDIEGTNQRILQHSQGQSQWMDIDE